VNEPKDQNRIHLGICGYTSQPKPGGPSRDGGRCASPPAAAVRASKDKRETALAGRLDFDNETIIHLLQAISEEQE